MSEQVRSVTRGGIRFQSSFTIRWELEDKVFLKIDIICLDDSLKYVTLHRILMLKVKARARHAFSTLAILPH